MSLRGSLVLVLLAVALSALSATLLLEERAARGTADATGRLFDATPREILRVRLLEREEGRGLYPRAVFERDDSGGWRVAVPALGIRDVADARAVEDLLAFVQLARRDPVALAPAEAGLGEPEWQVVVDTGAGPEFVYLGPLAEGGELRYAAHDRDPDTVHAVRAELTRILQRPGAELRSLDLFQFGATLPERIDFRPAGEGERVLFELLPEGWMLREPVRWPASPPVMAYLLSHLKQMRAREVAPLTPGARAARGLGEEATEVRLLLGGQEQVVRFGADGPATGTAWAVREGRDAIFLVESWLRDLVERGESGRYRRRELGLLREAEPGLIAITQGEETLRLRRGREGWTAGGARDWPVDQETVNGTLLPALRTLRVQAFGGVDAAGAGLDPPATVLTCRTADGRPLAGLSVGESAEGAIYARLEGREEILQLRDEPESRLLLRHFAFCRDRILARFDATAVGRVTIERPGERRVYGPMPGSSWQLVEPERRPLGRDNADFAFLVFRLSVLTAERVVRDEVQQWDRFGLDHPRARVIVTVPSAPGGADGAAPVALDLAVGAPVRDAEEAPGGTAGGGVYARLAGSDAVFVIGEALAGDIDRRYD